VSSTFLKSTNISLNILPRSRANLGESLTIENPGVYVLETNFSGSLKLPEDKIVIGDADYEYNSIFN
jgi:hypothetical protein